MLNHGNPASAYLLPEERNAIEVAEAMAIANCYRPRPVRPIPTLVRRLQTCIVDTTRRFL